MEYEIENQGNPRFGFLRPLAFPRAKITVERKVIERKEGDFRLWMRLRKCDETADGDPEKGFRRHV